ncbi:hypothetical protein CDAR_524981 [Caerostris darwini]|uniref:Uncharacterized protein n=1 Tax=Caerostris darwini TaxID=1538125 RepID=A0AAV4QZY7_9ARAC|nr:hypothetical protein CDAR_524981 [Caerostris darwini]
MGEDKVAFFRINKENFGSRLRGESHRKGEGSSSLESEIFVGKRLSRRPDSEKAEYRKTIDDGGSEVAFFGINKEKFGSRRLRGESHRKVKAAADLSNSCGGGEAVSSEPPSPSRGRTVFSEGPSLDRIQESILTPLLRLISWRLPTESEVTGGVNEQDSFSSLNHSVRNVNYETVDIPHRMTEEWMISIALLQLKEPS